MATAIATAVPFPICLHSQVKFHEVSSTISPVAFNRIRCLHKHSILRESSVLQKPIRVHWSDSKFLNLGSHRSHSTRRIAVNSMGEQSAGTSSLQQNVFGILHLVLSLGIILAMDKFLKKAFVAAAIKFPSALFGMFCIFSVLVILDSTVPAAAKNLMNFFEPALLFIQRWLPLFYVPSLVVLPLAVKDIPAASGLKICFIIVGGWLASLAVAGYTAIAVRKMVKTEMVDAEPMGKPSPFSSTEVWIWSGIFLISFVAALLYPTSLGTSAIFKSNSLSAILKIIKSKTLEMVSKIHQQQRGRRIQIFIQSPDLQIPTHALTLNPNLTIDNLKSSLFPQSANHQSSSFYFTCNGRPLSDSSTICNSQISPLSTLILRTRISGGGGDGGATGAESRDCYLNMYAEKKPDQADPNEKRLSKWTNCALSFEPLKPPCVVDRLGNVFNKQSLVEGLLGKKLPKAFAHIKGLKDMITIQLAPIPGSEDVGSDVVSADARFQCPIAGMEFNGNYKFFAIRTCGHVLSSKALKEVKSSACLVCHKEFSETDKIVINGNEEEVAALREKMEEEKGKLKEKKAKKVKNGGVGVNGTEGPLLDSSRLSGTKHGIVDNVKVAEKVLLKVEGNGKVANGGGGVAVKAASNGSVKRFKATDIAPPNATKEVYASIFTSSKKSNFKETYSCRSLPLGRN